MASKNKRHIHKYYRANLGYATVYACALSDCSHYMPIHMEPLLNGKKSICWGCGSEMILHANNMQMDQPICDNCKLGIPEPVTEMSEELKKKLEELGIDRRKLA